MMHESGDDRRAGFGRQAWGLLSALWTAAVIVAAAGAAAPVQAAPPPPPGSRIEDGEIAPGRPANWDVFNELRPAPGTTNGDTGTASTTAAPTDCLGSPTRQIRYTSDGVIHLAGCGQSFTLTQVAASSVVGPTRLELVDPTNKIWFLKVKLIVEEGATLTIAGGPNGDTNWLRLISDDSNGIWLRAENGTLMLRDTKVTSWDATRNSVDTNYNVASNGSGGRSYIAARTVLRKGRTTAPPTACSVNGGSQEPYEARMDVVNTEIGYLGYDAAESYGIVWKVYYKVDSTDPNDKPPPGRQLYALVDIFGAVSGSTFHHNYFGSYSFGAYCMNWTGNTFEQNVKYGLDPHDDSDYLTISGNIFHDNGDHGVICSVECDHLVITNNQSYNNQHGIMIHRNVNGALIEGNTSYNNRGAGIAIFDSHDAIVRNNTVTNNVEAAVRLSVGASRNLIENNTLTGLSASSTGNGYVIYTYKGSDAPTSGDGLPKQNIFRNNRLTGYKSPLLKIGEAVNNVFEGNTIAGTANNYAFSKATGNIIRNSEVGKTFKLSLDSASTTTLEDTRALIWLLPNGLSTSAAAAGSSLSLTYSSLGGSQSITTLDFSVRPTSGSVIVQPTTWTASTHSWTERSSTTTGAVSHAIGGFSVGSCYAVTANGTKIGVFRAESDGHIRFSYTGGYSGTVTFNAAAATCGTAPEPPLKVFAPTIIR